MRKIYLILFLIAAAFKLSAQTHVNGYFRSNGTYVEPHYRSSPNSTKLDNWSTKGNINPYTGAEGTKNVDEQYNYNYSSSSYYNSSTNTSEGVSFVNDFTYNFPSHLSETLKNSGYNKFFDLNDLDPSTSIGLTMQFYCLTPSFGDTAVFASVWGNDNERTREFDLDFYNPYTPQFLIWVNRIESSFPKVDYYHNITNEFEAQCYAIPNNESLYIILIKYKQGLKLCGSVGVGDKQSMIKSLRF